MTIPFRRASTVDLADIEALDHALEGVLRGVPPVLAAAADPDHAFTMRPLLDAAAGLRIAFETPVPATPGRAALMAQLHWTPQARPPARAHLEELGRNLRVRLTTTASAFAVSGQPRRLAAPAGVFALALVMAFAFASSGGTASASMLTILQGTVEVQTVDGWQPLADGAAVSPGDRVRLGADSVALLTFADGSVLRLAEHADIALTKATFEGAREVHLDHRAGHIEARVPLDARPGAAFTLTAPGALVEVASGAFASDVTTDGTRVDDVHGRVAVHREPLDARDRASDANGTTLGVGPAEEPAAARDAEEDRAGPSRPEDAGSAGSGKSGDRPRAASEGSRASDSRPGQPDASRRTGAAPGAQDRPASLRPSARPALVPSLDERLAPASKPSKSPTPGRSERATATATPER